ncbi:MAG: hypothetical protein ABEH56_04610 [Salinirussus sp.]
MTIRIRRPEYTGENRCLPCTVVNVLIAAAASAVVGAGIVGATRSPVVGTVAGAAVFGLSAAAIYVRGYLVPGTPALTERYVPRWLLRAFGKAPGSPGSGVGSDLDVDPETGIDPERVLTDLGVLRECPEGDDLCLTPAFRDRWHRGIDRAKGADRDRLLGLLGVEAGSDAAVIEAEGKSEAFRVVVGDERVGQWESRAAFVADLGAAVALSDQYAGWSDLPATARGRLLYGLRLFVDTCPDCGGAPEFDTGTVRSCCSARQVATVSCPDCGARLFESAVTSA